MNSRVAKAGGYLLLSLAISFFSACGDDSDDTMSDGGSGSGGMSAAGKGGKGGSGGKGGAGGAGSIGGVTCGGETCTVNGTLLQIAPDSKACCTADNKCGQPTSSGKCLLKNAPGTPDSKCPMVTVMAMGASFPQAGCCTPQGKCGANFSIVDYGCIAREDLEKDMGGPVEGIACGDSAPDAGN